MRLIVRIAAVVAAGIVCALLLVRWVYIPHHCNGAVTNITTSTEIADATPNDYDRLVRARRNLEELAAIRPWCAATEVRVAVLTAANEEMVGRPEDAVRSYDQALEVDRRAELYAARARLQVRLGRIDEAVESYAIASRMDVTELDRIGSEEILRRVRERLRAPL
jgi:tetratricopeptide (TPR) repeat protein